MHNKSHVLRVFLIVCLAALFLPGCSKNKNEWGQNHTNERRTTSTEFLIPIASGKTTYGKNGVSIDASNTAEGYVMVKYQGSSSKTKLQITTPNSTVYSYNLQTDEYETFPLSGGDGTYKITVLEHVQDDMYAIVFSQDIQVKIGDAFKPFLYPNQYVWFTPETNAVALSVELSKESSNDLDYVEKVYGYVIKNIAYDDELAATIQADYLPDIDHTLEVKKGICFDYASLMSAMLRAQNIPTKLEVGYSGDAYHAWISVYLKEIGWVNGIIEFDGKNWSLMDPTLAANNSNSSVKEYIGDGSNYTLKYSY